MKTQGRQLIEILKKRGMTNMEILKLGISTCPWKRIDESLQRGEKLTKHKNDRGLNVYRVIKVYKPNKVWVVKWPDAPY